MNFVDSRESILQFLKKELVGPSPSGEEIDVSKEIFLEKDQAYKQWRQAGSGEEILSDIFPVKRYGVGVIYPKKVCADDQLEEDADDVSEMELYEGMEKIIESPPAKEAFGVAGTIEEDEEDFEIPTVHTYRPSSMGVSFYVKLKHGMRIRITANGGRYVKKEICIASDDQNGKDKIWWLRVPVKLIGEWKAEDLLNSTEVKMLPHEKNEYGLDGLNISLQLFSRKYSTSEQEGRLITAVLVNNEVGSKDINSRSLFQCQFEVELLDNDGNSLQFEPFPVASIDKDDEEKSFELLYRKFETFAIGHGCSANWIRESENGSAIKITAESLPVFELPSITPEAYDGKNILSVKMANLAYEESWEIGKDELQKLINAYEAWIKEKEKENSALDVKLYEIGKKNLRSCKEALSKMRNGFKILENDLTARKAFHLANRAMLIQKYRELPKARELNKEGEYDIEYKEPHEPSNEEAEKYRWRAFQIAFFLMSVESVVEPLSNDRKTVDVLWFPTGGGKTEAYLAISAFAIFFNRLKYENGTGVNVIMRYTLRLLTAQQFIRAASLVCAMEYLRRNKFREILGDKEFSVGIWLGSSTTPNTRKEAEKLLRSLKKGGQRGNPFVLDRCPWCSAQIGPIDKNKKEYGNFSVAGIELKSKGGIIFACHDYNCEFKNRIPVYVIDEDIYSEKPSIVIGTIDKFALLAWKPEARSLFGINKNGERENLPPSLIIQDELHLISGPLGSVAGIYEPVIEDLCSYEINGQKIIPKIICASATVRRFKEQIKNLYGRDYAFLFPPPALSIDDSFFARFAKDKNGKLLPGKIFVGVFAPGLGSNQTAQVRTVSALLQAPLHVKPTLRDPWWTLMIFFNSLRELGTGLSLLQSDIPIYLKTIKKRLDIPYNELRKVRNIMELTGRLKSYEISESISKLEKIYQERKNKCVDVCLASNIIEVGIDIDRLSLMMVAGQPKTTSQYIQVTGRIGRKWKERPGLIVMVYSPWKPRDRSHYERFRSYHERLYSQIEAVSVTPFSVPVMERALHASVVSHVRQKGADSIIGRPFKVPDELKNNAISVLTERINKTNADCSDKMMFNKIKERLLREWKHWQKIEWGKMYGKIEPDWFMAASGSYIPPSQEKNIWTVPMSMRNVDVECQVEVTLPFIDEEED